MNISEQEILALNDPDKSYLYCYFNKGTANIKAHQQIIIDSKNLHYCFLFAINFPNTNLKLFEQIIINSKHIYYCYFFAKLVKESNKQLLSEIVLASGNLDYIKKFYNEVDFDKTKYETLMLFI
jgi:hypothetical protein